MALPDGSTFIIEDTTFDDAEFEANHHCDVGVTGILCFPQYVLDNVRFKNASTNRWARFQSSSPANYGGVFTLSPPNADIVMAGGTLEDSFFPQGYVSLVSHHYTYLLNLPGSLCILSSTQFGDRYDGGILCKVPLRSLKVYSRGLTTATAPSGLIEVWYGREESGEPDASQWIAFHEIGGTRKQGYSFPVIPGSEHYYKISPTFPSSWVSCICKYFPFTYILSN